MAQENKYYPQSVPHPGDTLAEKLEEMEMGPKEFAIRTVKPEKTITAILKGTSSITPDMAVRFENVTKIPAHFWMNHQMGYDEYMAREKWKAVIEETREWAALFPVSDMVKKGWLPQVVSIQEKSSAMLAFFGFSGHKAWEDYYFNQQLKVAFRISLKSTKKPYAISAWLRQGELQSARLKSKVYVEKNFIEALPELKIVMEKQPDKFFNQVQDICLEAGVKVVHTPCLSRVSISGSTRWLKDTPLIQLSDRYGKNDNLQFTFFHEAGHIILHGKKDIFLETIDYTDVDKVKEKQADDFALIHTRQ